MKFHYIIIALLILPLVSAEISEVIENEDVQIKDLYCNPQGKMGFKMLPIRDFGEATIKGIIVRQAGASNFGAITGTWTRETLTWNEQNVFRTAEFNSDEAQIRNEGTQELKVYYDLGNEEKEINLLFECPGTEFSCKLFDISVEKCGSSNGIFTAEYNLKGYNAHEVYNQIPEYTIDDLTFVLVTEDRYCDQEGNCGKSAGIPPGASLEFIGDERVKMTWEYQTMVKGTSISLVPAQSCEKKILTYKMKASDFKNCDPDPYAEEFVCDGCELGTICILEGGKIIQDGESLFCYNGALTPQKPAGSSCDSNIECLTNFCVAGVCANELLPVCADGELTEACKCGDLEIRSWEGKFCCKEEISETGCKVTGTNINQEIKCGEGYKLEGETCIKIEEKETFWSKLGSFFTNLFKRRE